MCTIHDTLYPETLDSDQEKLKKNLEKQKRCKRGRIPQAISVI